MRLHTTANTHATTSNIAGATMLGVVASVCTQPESGVKILGTGELLSWGYLNSSISGVIFTPEKEFFKLLFGFKINSPK